MKTITDEMCETGVNVNKPIQDIIPKNQHYIRQLNKGKSFSFSKWSPLSKYTNDAIRQDFVSYKNAILACKISHVASSEPVLIYDKTGRATGVSSREWIFVISSSINYNNYYIDGNLTNNLGKGLSLEDGKIVATSGAILEENIQLNIDLSNDYLAGHIFERGTSVQEVLNAIFTSTRLGRGDGIQMYTQEMLDEMEDIPEQYVQIPSPTDLNKVNESGKTYLDIMFSAIRSLQAEVAKMRNAFKYGMQSYTGTDTTMSEVVNDIAKDEEEPLWATDENDLSLTSYHLNFDESEIPFTNPENIDVSTPGVAKIKGNTSWTDYQSELIESPDSKIYVYTTTDRLNSNYNFISDGSSININLNGIWQHNSLDKYNTLVILSRKVLINDVLCGNNYIWISISNPKTNTPILEGYYNPDKNKVQSSIYLLNNIYNLERITLFAEQNLYKFDIYTKYQDFSIDVQASIPTDTDYKYKVAHLTIRSVDNSQELAAVKPYLLNNELIWQADANRLLIKTNDTIVPIGGTVYPDTGMTEQEVIEKLKEMGIISNGDDGLTLNPVADITFVHSGTGKQFKFTVDSEGELRSQESANGFTDIVEANSTFRGFSARALCSSQSSLNYTDATDLGLYADRIRIGAIYAPYESDKVYGCTHAFVELENTSNQDFPLAGCYLTFVKNSESNPVTYSLPLTGIIKAGSTYLIRGAKYVDATNKNAFIKVDDYDQEWYDNGELLDLSINDEHQFGFALTYNSPARVTDVLVTSNQGSGVSDKEKYNWAWNYLDAIVIGPNEISGGIREAWATTTVVPKPNSIIKNTFELDPAKQAFQGLNTYDSSRIRTASSSDTQILSLDKEYIEFPHSDAKYPISLFTPRASKYKKVVTTDKTKFDMDKPNAVMCAFGINGHTTRCFNWVSAGYFDEYVFVRQQGETNWNSFSSYTEVEEDVVQNTNYPCRKEFEKENNNLIYARLTGTFPGTTIQYTSHKCIIQLTETPGNKTVYEYIVGRKDKDGNPLMEHCSEIRTFTLHPTNATPIVYQITDQQGFHWIEYQVWAAAAKVINDKINQEEADVLPIIINTGDMTQNGTRVNEWLDYFNAGEPLFNHLEQMEVVGNNDLCDIDEIILGTGNDVGKSNPYYYHVFHCYEIDEGNEPLINGKYIPSMYYFELCGKRYVMVNSELTKTYCKEGLKCVANNGDPINAYTGWSISDTPSYNTGNWLYTNVYNMLSDANVALVACHEMPFTVITQANLKTGTKTNSRSLNGSSLVGSHLNQMDAKDTKGIYWFSRLLEHFNVKLCIGGHKHTYAITYPIRENYTYNDTNSADSGPMEMLNTLQSDDINIIQTSKLPIITQDPGDAPNGYFYPCTVKTDDTWHKVIYFMCQATGYKLTSNKELPSNYQKFSQLIPETTPEGNADENQQYPMYARISTSDIQLNRITNILKGFKFTQHLYGEEPTSVDSIVAKENSNYGDWTGEGSIITY